MADFFCSNCGLPGHRYGTTDIHHTADKTACINGLRHRLRKLTEAARAVAEPMAYAAEHGGGWESFCLDPNCDRDSWTHLGSQFAELQAALAEIEDVR